MLRRIIEGIIRVIKEELSTKTDGNWAKDFWTIDGRPMNNEEIADTKEGLSRIWREATDTDFQTRKR